MFKTYAKNPAWGCLGPGTYAIPKSATAEEAIKPFQVLIISGTAYGNGVSLADANAGVTNGQAGVCDVSPVHPQTSGAYETNKAFATADPMVAQQCYQGGWYWVYVSGTFTKDARLHPKTNGVLAYVALSSGFCFLPENTTTVDEETKMLCQYQGVDR